MKSEVVGLPSNIVVTQSELLGYLLGEISDLIYKVTALTIFSLNISGCIWNLSLLLLSILYYSLCNRSLLTSMSLPITCSSWLLSKLVSILYAAL